MSINQHTKMLFRIYKRLVKKQLRFNVDRIQKKYSCAVGFIEAAF